MNIGVAIVVVAVLYFIDKHNRWRQTLKLVVALAVAAGLLYGSVYMYGRYEAWREAKATTMQRAQTAQVRALIFDPKFPKLSMEAQQAALSRVDPDFGKLSPKGFVEAETGLWETGSEDEKTTSLGGPDPYAALGWHAVAPFSDLSKGAKVGSMLCGVNEAGHIVPDGKGGCVPPPPDGYIIDAPKAK